MGIAIVLLLVVVAILLALLLRAQGRTRGVTDQLRMLLLERAEGKIDDETFSRRQAALHAAVVTEQPLAKSKLWLFAVPVVALMAAIGFWLGSAKSGKPAEPALMSQSSSLATPRFEGFAKPKAAGASSASQAGQAAGDLHVMAKRLAEKLAKEPGNGEGWLLLARTYREINQPKEAAAAFAKASPLVSLDAAMLADWADSYVLSNGRKWDAEAAKIVQRALAADPKHLKSLALAGSEAFERGDYKKAISYWQRMRAAAPEGSIDAKLADANIQEAEAVASGKKNSPTPAVTPAKP